ncbi:hypothetical protein BDW67DRAFT_160636 [Aspergillus spinulosporus]
MESTIDRSEVNDVGRAQLIHKVSALTGIKHVDSATWSCLWFSDVKRLLRATLCYSGISTETNYCQLFRVLRMHEP